jgi:hypothetical protein
MPGKGECTARACDIDWLQHLPHGSVAQRISNQLMPVLMTVLSQEKFLH